ncbi:hypothetical protein FB451DRAFT_1454753 [Mycena latifolia]|nr:hypothetical protein FB451DRAFT_1454753 [Mycena latifolia]
MFFIKTAQSVEAWGRTRAAENRAASELFPVRVPYSSQRSLKVARAVVDKVFIRRMRSIRWMVDMRAGGKDDRRPQADDPSDFNFQVEHSHHLTQASFDHRYHHAVLLQTPTVFIEQPVKFRSVVQQACTLPVFGGTCTPLNGTACTNTVGKILNGLYRHSTGPKPFQGERGCQAKPDGIVFVVLGLVTMKFKSNVLENQHASAVDGADGLERKYHRAPPRLRPLAQLLANLSKISGRASNVSRRTLRTVVTWGKLVRESKKLTGWRSQPRAEGKMYGTYSKRSQSQRRGLEEINVRIERNEGEERLGKIGPGAEDVGGLLRQSRRGNMERGQGGSRGIEGTAKVGPKTRAELATRELECGFEWFRVLCSRRGCAKAAQNAQEVPRSPERASAILMFVLWRPHHRRSANLQYPKVSVWNEEHADTSIVSRERELLRNSQGVQTGLKPVSTLRHFERLETGYKPPRQRLRTSYNPTQADKPAQSVPTDLRFFRQPPPGLQSLMLNPDADCAAFTLPDCQFTPDQPALEEFSDTSEHLEGLGIQSVQCFENAGTVNGFTQGSPEDIAQEQADEDAADGIVLTPPANCTEGPIDISADQQREDDADGIVVSGPITCSFD